MRKTLLTLALILPAGFAGAQSPEDTVAARQGYYKLLGAQMAVLAPMAQGKMEFNAEQAGIAAGNIATLSQLDIGGLFAPGTSSSDIADSNAKSEIWENMAAVGEKGAAFRAAAAEMPAAAASLETLQAAVGKLGGTCKACHDDFREK